MRLRTFLFAFCFLTSGIVSAQNFISPGGVARRFVRVTSVPASCTAGDVLVDVSGSPAVYYNCPVATPAVFGASGLNTAMSNAAAVALNTSLLPGTDGSITLGNQTHRFSQVWLKTGTFVSGIQFYDSVNSVANAIYWSALIGPRWAAGGFGSIQHHLEGLSGVDDVTWPDASGTVVLDSTLQILTNKTIADLVTGGSTPAVSNTTANSCGTTTATIAGNNTTGVVTVGATAGTNCTITFTVAAPTRRQCTVTNETTANLSRSTYLTTTTSTVEGTFVAGDKISYVCAVY